MLIYLFLIAVVIIFLCFKWVDKRYSYFKERGIPQIDPQFPYGNAKTMGKTESPGLLLKRFYNTLKEKSNGKSPIGGIYTFVIPKYLVLDVEILRNILVRDFHNFMNRGLYHNKKDDPLTGHLLTLDGDEWKGMRKKLSPTFSSGKMKFMFSTIVDTSHEFVKCIETEIKISNEIEMRDILARFTTDVIGNCAFGLECNSLKEPNAIFREMGRKIFSREYQTPMMKRVLASAFPNIARKLRFKILHEDISNFFLKTVKDNVEYRQTNNIQRNDFLNILIEMGKRNSEEGLTITEMAAQAFVFFLAGFETSSTASSFAMFELALNQTIQDQAREEIKTVLAKYDGKMTYECIMEMKYIEMIIYESLRKYPPLPVLFRRSAENYKIENTDIIIDKGRDVIIPSLAIHHDPQHYPNPEIYDPGRFTDEAKENRHPFAFLPFGDGPRNCIGLRFGMLQSRIGLVALLNNFKFTISTKTVQPITFKPFSGVLQPEGGLYLHVEKI